MRPFLPPRLTPLLLVLACISSTGPGSNVTGAWSSTLFGANQTLQLNLLQRDTLILGTGQYMIPVWIDTVQVPGPIYQVTVTGTNRGPRVALVMRYPVGPATGAVAFSGVLQDPQHLRGYVQECGDCADPVTFTRR